MPTATFLRLSASKQKRIIDAAVKEFSVRNVQEGKLSNIVKDAGISRGSLYQYFPSKEDLYNYLFDTLRADRAEYVKPAFALYKTEPFLRFFEEFYLRDSEFLLMNPSHIELGKQMYGSTDSVSRGLIHRLQTRYKEWFLVAIEHDKEKGIIDHRVSSSTLADLFVHFVTDIFIFQSVHSQFSVVNIREHCRETMYIIWNGIRTQPEFP